MKLLNILITNDDGYDAPGLAALFDAARGLGRVHVVAPKTEQSACSHKITMRQPITVERLRYEPFGDMHTVAGTPADCVRLACAELLDEPVDLVLAGINRGANAGVDTFYSGTIAAAREGAILGLHAISISHAIRSQVRIDWKSASRVTADLLKMLVSCRLPVSGFWSVNLPPTIPADALQRIHSVPVSTTPMPMDFERVDHPDGRTSEFRYGAYYWDRDTNNHVDFSVIRNGGIAISPISLSTSIPGCPCPTDPQAFKSKNKTV